MKTVDNTDHLMRPRDVAALLSLSLAAVYQMAGRGLLPCVKIGRCVRFRRGSIEKLIDSKEKVAYGKVA